MTDAQNDAIEKIMEIMREHFQSGVVVLCAESEDDKSDDVRCGWTGGYASALGLLEIGKMRAWNSRANDLRDPKE